MSYYAIDLKLEINQTKRATDKQLILTENNHKR